MAIEIRAIRQRGVSGHWPRTAADILYEAEARSSLPVCLTSDGLTLLAKCAGRYLEVEILEREWDSRQDAEAFEYALAEQLRKLSSALLGALMDTGFLKSLSHELNVWLKGRMQEGDLFLSGRLWCYRFSVVDFERMVGRPPVQDDLHRLNCRSVGQPGHYMCGLCEEHRLPCFECGCLLIGGDSNGSC
jgi:hypothetical protein